MPQWLFYSGYCCHKQSKNYPVLHERCVKDHSLVAKYVGEIVEEFGCPANIMVKRVVSYNRDNLPVYSKPRLVGGNIYFYITVKAVF